jgi:chemotaxis response regulator CheB
MELRNVFVIGDSLFAETLVQILGDSQAVKVIGTAPTPKDALPALKNQSPDAVVVAVAGDDVGVIFAPIMVAYPNLPIIHGDLSTNTMQVITNQSIDARRSNLLAAIAALPKWEPPVDDDKSAEKS